MALIFYLTFIFVILFLAGSVVSPVFEKTDILTILKRGFIALLYLTIVGTIVMVLFIITYPYIIAFFNYLIGGV